MSCKKKYKIRKDGRIVALRNFGNVSENDAGGFIGSEKNLSHDGTCWVSDNARVSGEFSNGNCPVFVGTRHAVSYAGAIDGEHYISIGCVRKSIQDWANTYRSIGWLNRYSESEIDEYGYYISMIDMITKRGTR